MRKIIKFVYFYLFLFVIFIFGCVLSYFIWIICDHFNVNLFGAYFDNFLSIEHIALLGMILYFVRKKIMDFSAQQSIFLYKSYLMIGVFFKYFIIKFSICFGVIFVISSLILLTAQAYPVSMHIPYLEHDIFSFTHIMYILTAVMLLSPLFIMQTKIKIQKIFFKYYETKGRYISPTTKRFVLKRDKKRCRRCGSKKQLEFDHIKPYSRGGSNRPHNVQLLCFKCNRSKGNKYA